MADRALDGIKIVELAQLVAGPYCAKLLADLGADVLKVEPPCGDRARSLGPFPGDCPHHEQSGLFLYLNTNKRGITLNPQAHTGRRLLCELVRRADVLVEDGPPPAMAWLGLDYEALREINPGLVVTSITPFGQSGPYRDYKAYDITCQAAGGIAYVTGDPEQEPLIVPGNQADYQAALNAAVGTLAALLCRETSGQGQHVDISEQESIASVLGDVISFFSYQGRVRPRRVKPQDFADLRLLWPAGIYPCKDGYINITVLEPHQWRSFVDLIGNPPWATDPRYEDRYFPQEQGAADIDLEPLITEALGHFTREELFHEGQRRRIPVSPVYDAAEVLRSPQLVERGFFVPARHPAAGTLTYPGAPYKLGQTPWRIERTAPLLGEHNEEVLVKELGLSRTDLVKMAQAGII